MDFARTELPFSFKFYVNQRAAVCATVAQTAARWFKHFFRVYKVFFVKKQCFSSTESCGAALPSHSAGKDLQHNPRCAPETAVWRNKPWHVSFWCQCSVRTDRSPKINVYVIILYISLRIFLRQNQEHWESHDRWRLEITLSWKSLCSGVLWKSVVFVKKYG